jgi:hypothetical protein
MSSASAPPRTRQRSCSRAWKSCARTKRRLVCIYGASAIANANFCADILRIQATLCNRPHDSRGNSIKVTAYVTGIIPVLVIIMRFTSRYLGGNKLWWDDWIHLASVVSTQPQDYQTPLTIVQDLGHSHDRCATHKR